MAAATLERSNSQIQMPGMPTPAIRRRMLSLKSVVPGQLVEYHGRIRGGPRQGIRGTILRTGSRQAVVDLGSSGRWSIPYYFLSIPDSA